MIRYIVILHLIVIMAVQLGAQPYVDPLQVRYTYAFKGNHQSYTPFTHLWAGSDIPIKISTKKNTYLILSPYYEEWHLNPTDDHQNYSPVRSVSFPFGLILPLSESKWTINILPIIRSNAELLLGENTFQYGGIAFATIARKTTQKFRLGVYMNKEFFGLFVIPLMGVDWQIDDRNYLFGLLPGRLSYEHQWNKKLYGGATFRAITNSYHMSEGPYLRLDDNQISLYADYYASEHICLTVEPGFGIFRKLRTGINGNRQYLTDYRWGDGFFIKLSASYRIRV